MNNGKSETSAVKTPGDVFAQVMAEVYGANSDPRFVTITREIGSAMDDTLEAADALFTSLYRAKTAAKMLGLAVARQWVAQWRLRSTLVRIIRASKAPASPANVETSAVTECSHRATDPACQCWGVYYDTQAIPGMVSPASGFVWQGNAFSGGRGNFAWATAVMSLRKGLACEAARRCLDNPKTCSADDRILVATTYEVRRYPKIYKEN